MATYVTTFEFGVAGDAEQKLRQLKELLDQVKQAGSGGNSTIGDAIKTSAEKGEAAVKGLKDQVDKLPKDKQVDVKAETGTSKAAIKDLEGQVDKLPKDKQVDVKVSAGSSTTTITDMMNSINKLPGSKDVKVDVNAGTSKATITDMMNNINKLPKSKETKVDVNAGRSNATMSELMAKFGKLPKSKQVDLNINAGRSAATMSSMVRNLYKIPKQKNVKLDADSTKGKSAIDQFNEKLKQTDTQANKTHGLLKTVFAANLISNGVTSGIQAISSGIVSMGHDLSEASATWKTFDQNMENIGKSSGQIKTIQSDLQSFAQKTIYSASDMASTYSQLAAVGTKNTTKLVEGFGGLAAAASDPTQAMKTLSQQATQMAAKPTVQWQDFKLMLEQTPAGISAVAKTMHESTSQLITDVGNSKVKTQDFFAAIEKTGTNKNFTAMATQFKTVGQALDGLKESLTAKLQPAFNQFSSVGIKAVTSVSDSLMKINFNAIAKSLLTAFQAIGTVVGTVFGVASDAFKMFKYSFELNVDKPLKSSDVLGALSKLKKGFADFGDAVAPLTQTVGALAGSLAAGVFNNARSLFSGLAQSLSSINSSDAAKSFSDLADKLAPLTSKLSDFAEKAKPVSKALGEMAGDIAKNVWSDFAVVLSGVGAALKVAGSFIGTVAKGIATMFGVKTSGSGLGALGGIIESIAKNQTAVKIVSGAIVAMLTAKMAANGLSLATSLIDGLLSKSIAIGGLKGALKSLFSVSGKGGFAESIGMLKQIPGVLKELSGKSSIFKGLTSGLSLPKMLGGKGMTIGMKAQISNMKNLPMLGKAAAAAVGVGIAASSGLDIYKGIKAKNPTTKFKDIGSGIGTAVGGGIGFALGGPAGAMVGSTVGKLAGKWAGVGAKEFVDGWNKKGKGAKPPSGLLPKAGYYARAAGDGVASFAKSIISGAKKHKTEITAALISPVAGVAAWFLKDTKTGKAVATWAKGFSKDVKKMGFGAAVQKQINDASKAFSKTKFGKWFDGIGKSFDSWKKSFSKSWSKHWNSLTSSAKKGLSSAQKGVSSFGSSTSKWLGSWTKSFSRSWSKHWNGLTSSAKKGLSSAQKGINSFGSSSSKWLGSWTKSFARTWSKHWSSLNSSVKSGLNSASKTASSFGSTISKWWGSWSKSFASSWSKHWSDVRDNMHDKLDKAEGYASSFGKNVSSWWSGWSSSFSKGWHSFWSGISDFFNSIFKKLGSFAKTGMNDVIGFINGGISGVNKVISFFGSSKSIGKIATLATGTGGHSGGPALINDGKGPDYKELVITPDNHMMMAQDRNVLIPDLPVGSQVLSGSDTKNYMNSMGIDHYASGTSGAASWIKGKLSDISSWVKDKADTVEKLLKHPLASLENIWDKAVSALTPKSDFGKDFAPPAGKYMIKQAESWFKSLLKKADDDLGDAGGGKGAPSGSGVQRWKSQVIQALKANGLSTSTDMVNRVLRQMATESSGNEKAVQGNIGDVNNATGDLAKGLMQTISATFNAYKFPSHGNIFNGYDNLLAALHYAKATYGPSLSFLGNGHGYADGGILNSPEFALVGEAGKEYIINPARPSAMKLIMGALKDTLAKQPVSVTQAFKPKSYSSSASLSSFAGSTDQASDNSLLGRIDKLVDNTQKLIDKNQDIYMDSEKVTKQVSLQGAKDINILQAQLGGN